MDHKNNKRFFLAGTIIFIIFSVNICLIPNITLAGNLDHFIRGRVQATDKGFLDESMGTITHLGHPLVDLALTSLLNETVKAEARQAIIISGGITLVLKYIIGQKRPPGPVEYRPFTFDDKYFSMPSGHTATAFALATVIADNNPEQQTMVYSLATLVGISRLYEDKHWFSNIIAGALIGYYSAKMIDCRW